jgi:hypothetical protein
MINLVSSERSEELPEDPTTLARGRKNKYYLHDAAHSHAWASAPALKHPHRMAPKERGAKSRADWS